MLEIAVVDDDNMTRLMLTSVLKQQGYQVETFSNTKTAYRALVDRYFALAIVDLDFKEGPSGIDLIKAVYRDRPELPVIVLTNHRSPALIDSKVRGLGNIPYLIKDDLNGAETILAAVKSVIDRRPFRSPSIPASENPELPALTTQQADVLRQLAMGMTTQQMAEERHTTKRAVERLVQRTLNALGIESSTGHAGRIQAVRKYLESGIRVR